MEQTIIKTQLKNMRMELCKMLDHCHDICTNVTAMNVVQHHCRNCDHGRHMREALKRIEELQRADREQRGVKRWSDSNMPGSSPADIQVKRSRKDKVDEQKPVQAGEDFKIDKSDWFSPRFKTFEDWLASQPKPHSRYVQRLIYRHGQNPEAKLAELYFTRTTPREKAAAKRAAPATRAKVIRGMTFEEALMWYEDHGVHVPKNMQPGGRLYQRWMRLKEDNPTITVGEVMDYKKHAAVGGKKRRQRG